MCFALLTDDGPYSKGSKDSGGVDTALVSRRQSIPGKGRGQLLLQNIGAFITLYLATLKIGNPSLLHPFLPLQTPKPKQNTSKQTTSKNLPVLVHLSARQKWLVGTGLSEVYTAGSVAVWHGGGGGYRKDRQLY